MEEPSSFSDLPRAIQVQLAAIGPLLFGAVVGFMLSESEAGYWVLTGLSVVGGIVGGLDHRALRAAATRGLVAGAFFGTGLVAAHEISGDAALATMPSPLVLLVAIAAAAGAGLGTVGGLLRARTAKQHGSSVSSPRARARSGDHSANETATPELKPGRSVRALQQAFREAQAPELAALIGDHEAAFAGWLRFGGPFAMRLTGMPGWWGKRFRAPAGGGDTLEGENLLRRRGRLVASIPMTAQVAPSRVDGRPALVISYPAEARWPHRLVKDELRPLDERTLLGLSFGLPLAPRGGAPFVLHRRGEGR